MRNNTTNPVRRILSTVVVGTAAALALAVAPVQASAKPFVQPASFISGRLVDASTHQPLAGVRVASYLYGDDSTASAISDANGRFVLAQVTGDEFAVLVRSSARHCGGFVRVLQRATGAPLDAIVTTPRQFEHVHGGSQGHDRRLPPRLAPLQVGRRQVIGAEAPTGLAAAPRRWESNTVVPPRIECPGISTTSRCAS